MVLEAVEAWEAITAHEGSCSARGKSSGSSR
jgi:hypothetical protein